MHFHKEGILLYNGLFWRTRQLTFIDPCHNNEMCVKKPNQSTKYIEICYFLHSVSAQVHVLGMSCCHYQNILEVC